MWQSGITHFCKVIFTLCYSNIPNCVNNTKTGHTDCLKVHGGVPSKLWFSFKILCMSLSQCCKNSSPKVWMWRYPNTRLKKTVLIPAFRRCKLFVMVVYHFHAKKTVLCQKTVKKAFFAGVKLHCPTSENKFSNNFWWNGWIFIISGMLGPSAVQWLWS